MAESTGFEGWSAAEILLADGDPAVLRAAEVLRVRMQSAPVHTLDNGAWARWTIETARAVLAAKGDGAKPRD